MIEKKTSYYIISLDQTPADMRDLMTAGKLRANWVRHTRVEASGYVACGVG